jgi:uncharacterized protein YggU (UPF0235/DUF167 family)
VKPTARLKLRVVPGARSSGVVGRYGEAWKVRVQAPPERGQANDAVLRLLADALSLPRDRVWLVSGHGRRDKIVLLEGISHDESERRLAAAERKDTGPR